MSLRQTSLKDWRTIAGDDRNQATLQTTISQTNTNGNELTQQMINTTTQQIQDTYWGHALPPKLDGVFRIGFRNINSLPRINQHSKNDEFVNDILNGELDIFGGSEVNIAWHNVKGVDKAHERLRGKLEFYKLVTSHNNDHEFLDTFQRGGTITVCSGSMCARDIESGSDSKTIGRWSWLKL
jgi:hypothetical protein